MRAKKSLGQHFLHERSALLAIRDALDPTPLDVVLEIGPGKGALTKEIVPFAGKVVAVEKDDFLYEFLKEEFAHVIDNGNLDLIHGDILDFDPEVLRFYKDFSYKLVGNIPYNITGAILKKFLSTSYLPQRAVFLVQKEVAERIVARDGKESVLSLSVKVYGSPKIVKVVKAGSFVPAPKVDSAILIIESLSKNFFEHISEPKFFEVLKLGFGQKRKKLISNLTALYSKEKLEEVFREVELDQNIRAEDLKVADWQKLCQKLI